MMSRAIKVVGFKFHPKCENLQLTILCYGDNKIVFTSAYLGFVSIIKNVFNKFKFFHVFKPILTRVKSSIVGNLKVQSLAAVC